jgi:hypothetical protein
MNISYEVRKLWCRVFSYFSICSHQSSVTTARRVSSSNNHGLAETIHNCAVVVNGGWGSWTAWTPCSETCGAGVQERHRECVSPRPEHGGLYCQGLDSERQPCHLSDCEGERCLVLFVNQCCIHK